MNKKNLKEKREQGITLIPMVIIGVIIVMCIGVIIVAVLKNIKKSDTNIVDGNTTAQENTSNESSIASQSSDNNNNKKFWYEKCLNMNQKDTYRLKLFYKYDAPIDLSTSDSFVKQYKCYPDGLSASGKSEFTTFSELLTFDQKIRDKCAVWLGYGENKGNGHYSDNIQLEIINNSDEQLSIKECYEKGWWRIHDNLRNASFLGFELSNGEKVKSDDNPNPFLNKTVELLGAPKHIYNLAGNDESTPRTYLLHYEYDGFDILIYVLELPEYNTVNQDRVEYYPKEQFKITLEKIKKDFKDFSVLK